MFYPDADDATAAAATCDPWHGEVADILSHDEQGHEEGEQGVQADPYGCGGLWERFLVHWQPNTQVCCALHLQCVVVQSQLVASLELCCGEDVLLTTDHKLFRPYCPMFPPLVCALP